jgi:16S rRNA (cytosine967-C5)-methyltransferase
MDARTAATKIVTDVLSHGRSLGTALDLYLEEIDAPSARPLAQELAFGVLRWYPRLAAMLQRLLSKPLRRKDQDLFALLLVGLYQVTYTRIPAYAAVAETVAVAQRLGKGWATGLINGTLRNYQRQREQLIAEADRREESRWAHPAWLIGVIAESWPQQWREILGAGNSHPPLSLRVNRLQLSRNEYLAALAAKGMEAAAIPHTDAGVVVKHPVHPAALPGFADGWLTVQDGAAQQTAGLLGPRAGERILDACCAPGGKTTHILEIQPGASVLALDKSPQRLAQVDEGLARLGLHAVTVAADAAAPQLWWDGTPFDRILLDAPCSATGVIRRHPDIKVLRRPEDIGRAVEIQRRLLESLWSLLKPGGMLLYATCSILAEENERQIGRFVDTQPDAQEDSIDRPWGHSCRRGWQILPGDFDMDGFYYARLVKQRG